MCPVRSVSYVSGRSKGLQLCKPFCFPFICDQPHSIENAAERDRLYREALTLEPNNVNAMIGLASTLAIRSQWIDSSDVARDKYVTDARDMALRIRAIDPRLRGSSFQGSRPPHEHLGGVFRTGDGLFEQGRPNKSIKVRCRVSKAGSRSRLQWCRHQCTVTG